MNEFNPYAPPETSFLSPRRQPLEGGELFRDGRYLVFPKGTELPDRCLRCNEPAEGYRLQRRLSWHPKFWYVLVIFPGLLFYVIVALCVRQTAQVAAPFCPRHQAQRSRAVALGWLVCLGAIGLFIIASTYDYGILAFAAAITFLVSLIASITVAQILVAKRINRHFVWLNKVCPEFLADLPEWSSVEMRSLDSVEL